MKKLFFVNLMAVIFLVFSGCTSDLTTDDSYLKNETVSTSDISTYSKISDDPYESYYLLHNACLSALLIDAEQNHADYNQSSDPHNKAFLFVQNYMQQNVSNEINAEWINNFYSNYEKNEYSSDERYLNAINSTYYNSLIDIVESNTDPLQVNSDIDQLIISLGNDNEIDEIEKIALKSAMLIGKESFKYWTDNQSKWESVGNQYYSPITEKKIKNKYAVADIQGAISGAISGAITGTPFAGAGAAPGALLGAMVGASWGSAVAGAWDHFGF